MRCQKFDAPGWVSFVGNTRQVLRHSASDNLLMDFLGGHKKCRKKVEPLKGFECGEGIFPTNKKREL